LVVVLNADVESARAKWIVHKREHVNNYIHNYNVNPRGDYEGVYEIIETRSAALVEHREYLNGVYHGKYMWFEIYDYDWIKCTYNNGRVNGVYQSRRWHNRHGWIIKTVDYVNDVIHGMYKIEKVDGGLIKIVKYLHGFKSGRYERYYGDAENTLSMVVEYKDGLKEGRMVTYDRYTQRPIKTTYYSYGKLVDIPVVKNE
jgi:antitoxin component YwqK of YwqJK toxin-antitoxin module